MVAKAVLKGSGTFLEMDQSCIWSLFSPPPSAWSFLCIYLFIYLFKLCFAPYYGILTGKCSTPPSVWSREKSLPLQNPCCDLLLPLGQTQNLKQRINKNQTHMGTQCSPWRHWKIKLRSYYSFMITNSRALSYAWATVESALLCRMAFQSPPMGFVIQRAPFVPIASELLMDEHQRRFPHVSLFHTYFNSNEDFCSLGQRSNSSESDWCVLLEIKSTCVVNI